MHLCFWLPYGIINHNHSNNNNDDVRGQRTFWPFSPRADILVAYYLHEYFPSEF